MPDLIQQIVKGFDEFVQREYAPNGDMKRVLDEKPTPQYLSFACMDPRSAPEIIFNLHSGDGFDLREAGPFIPAYDPENPKAAQIEEQVSIAISKGIEHILLVAHEDCAAAGKISEICEGKNPDRLSSLEKQGLQCLEAARNNFGTGMTPDQLHREVERQIIVQGQKNLLSYPSVQKAINQGSLHVHGLLFSLNAGQLLKYYPSDDKSQDGEFRVIAGNDSFPKGPREEIEFFHKSDL